MRNPNGYGAVYKLSGNRRNPWAVRKTVGWTFDENTLKSKAIYEFIGYYKTKKEAMIALANYNENPYSLKANTYTFEDIYEKWSNAYFEKIKNANGYTAAYKLCGKIKHMKFAEIRLDHLQAIADESGKNTPTLKNLKILLGLMYDYAVIHDIVPPDKRDKVRYLDISKPGNPNAYNRTSFNKREIKKIWDNRNKNIYYTVVLIMIYSGVRIGELLNLKKKNINLDERWFYIDDSKTKSGIRTVPISEKILPFFEYWIKRNCDYLICNEDDKRMTYDRFYERNWKDIMAIIGIKHTPHCTRYTFISLMTVAGVDDRIIKQIVGHKGKDVTEIVYTKIDFKTKLEAINLI